MKNKSNIVIYIYYILLMIILSSRQGEVEPSTITRILFVSAVVVPTLFVKELSYAAVITFFYSMTIYGFSYSYMPYTLSQYAFITILATIVLSTQKKLSQRPSPVFYIITAYVLVVNAVNSIDTPNANAIENTFWGLLMVCCLIPISDRKDSSILSQLSLCFELAAIVLSVYFFMNREQYAVSYGQGTTLERVSWVDPNYFGMVIGMGVVCGGLILVDMKKSSHSLIERIIAISTVIVSVPVLILNASRGAVLAVVVSLSILLISSKTKTIYKIIIIAIAVIGLFYLYNNHYFDLLEYRILEDESGGSGRFGLWQAKINAFSQQGLLNWLFGNGYYKGMNITGHYFGFHNEFVGFLVEYGIIGISLLLYLLYYPIKKANSLLKEKNERIKVYVVILYLTLCFMTLEPLGLGMFTFFAFYFYGYMLATTEEKSVKLYFS